MEPTKLISDEARLNLLLAYLEEDAGRGDITTEALGIEGTCMAEITAKQKCVLAGITAVRPLLLHFEINIHSDQPDGKICSNGDKVLILKGPAAALLKIERLILNIICRMSGIATATRMLVDSVSETNPDCLVAATRKTTPGFRIFEKEAVIMGGGHPHRFDLGEAVMVKDNHLKFVPDAAEAVDRAASFVDTQSAADTTLRYGGGKPRHKKWIEIEADTPETALAAAEAGADIIMLDNMSPPEAAATAAKLRSVNPDVKIEISGGITPENIMEYAKFADIISMGYLTHSAPSADFSMNFIIE